MRDDGSVLGWGANSSGQITIPSGATNVIAIGAGATHSLAITRSRAVVAWGSNSSGQSDTSKLGLSNVVSVAGGTSHSVALLADGSVRAWGDNQYLQTTIPAGLGNVTAIAATADSSLALATGAPKLNVILGNPAMQGGVFKASFPSQSGRVYRLEHAASLDSASWTPLPLAAGNGSILTIFDSNPANAQRFYRLREW